MSVEKILCNLFRNIRKVPIIPAETTKISYCNSKFFAGLLAPCHILDDWMYRIQREAKKR